MIKPVVILGVTGAIAYGGYKLGKVGLRLVREYELAKKAAETANGLKEQATVVGNSALDAATIAASNLAEKATAFADDLLTKADRLLIARAEAEARATAPVADPATTEDLSGALR